MTEARWNALLELAKKSAAVKAHDGRDYVLTYDKHRRCVWLYINGEVRDLYRPHTDIQYEYIMVFHEMWDEYVKSKQYTQ